MSRRYGRNQKRAHRAMIAALEGRLEALEQALVMDRALLRETSKKLMGARDEIKRARRILGERTAALEPQTLSVGDLPSGERFELPVDPNSAQFCPDAFDPRATLRRVSLEVLALEVREDWVDRLHLRFSLADQRIAYAISAEALRAMPAEDLAQRLGEEMARALVVELRARFA